MVYAAIIISGFTAMSAQILFLRDLLVMASGSELSIGLILAAWLFGGGGGSIVAGRLSRAAAPDARHFAFCQLLLAVLLPLAATGVRAAGIAGGFAPGQIMPLSYVAAVSFVTVAPMSFVLGASFAVGCALNAKRGKGDPVAGTYVLETVGTVGGGLMTSMALLRWAASLQTIALLGAVNALSGALLLAGGMRKGKCRDFALLAALTAACLAVSAVSLSGGWAAVDNALLRRTWHGYRLIDTRSSVYGTISFVFRDGQFSCFDNGLRAFTVPDPAAAEESVHYALLEHPAPRTALLIGGAAGGSVDEALKHPLESLDLVDLDPLIISMSRELLPERYTRALTDPRLAIHAADGRHFVQGAENRYDCIMLNLGDPYTALIGRYYTREFFRDAKRSLRDGGVLSFALTSSSHYLGPALVAYLGSVYDTIAAEFSDVKIVPGERAVFLARHGGTTDLTYDHTILEARSAERALDIRYVRDYYLFADMSRERTGRFERLMRERPGRPDINRDLRPISYYRATAYWASQFRDSFLAGWLPALHAPAVWAGIAFCMASMAFFGRKRRDGDMLRPVLAAVVSAGFSGMASQAVILLSFQALYGYLFYRIGIIMTLFMAGLALGAVFGGRMGAGKGRGFGRLRGMQLALCAYPVALYGSLCVIADGGIFARRFGDAILFNAAPFVAGLIGGAHFAFAGRLCLAEGRAPSAAGGLVYGADLLGSCAGAILAGAIMVPIVGAGGTCYAAAGLSAVACILLCDAPHRLRCRPN